MSLSSAVETSRKKKHRMAVNLILGISIAKALLLPLLFKAMAVMTGVSVILSTFSLIVASLTGYSKVAWQHAAPTIKLIRNFPGWSHYNEDYHEKYETFPEIKFENDALEHYHFYQK